MILLAWHTKTKLEAEGTQDFPPKSVILKSQHNILDSARTTMDSSKAIHFRFLLSLRCEEVNRYWLKMAFPMVHIDNKFPGWQQAKKQKVTWQISWTQYKHLLTEEWLEGFLGRKRDAEALIRTWAHHTHHRASTGKELEPGQGS